jgi:tetratricopeptide (TPR) repeat protein
VVGLVQVGDQAWADRYSYLPMIGLGILFTWGAWDTLERSPAQRAARLAAFGMAALVGAGLLTATALQLRYWRDTRALFAHAAEVTPQNARAAAVLGSLLADEGKLPEAIELYAQALRWKPDDPEAHFFLGEALARQGKYEEALAEYSRALWFKPLQAKTHLFMGVALAKQKKYDEAAAHYRSVLALDPESASAHNDLARVLHAQGRPDEAVEHYEAALKLDPALPQAHNNLGVLLVQKGRVAEGAAQLEEALRLAPGDAETQYNLALAWNQQREWKKALELFAKLEAGRRQDADLQCQMARGLAHLGQTRDAMSHYAQALLLRPDLAEALQGLAWILAADPRPEFRNGAEAVQMAEKACELAGRREASRVLTLAAAYAETARFAEALKAANEAQALAVATGQKELAAQCGTVASAAQAGQPWREGKPLD